MLLAVALLCVGQNAWGDDWYKDGSEVAAGSDYYLYNIGAGKFLDNGMNWGTRATVDNAGQALTLAVGATDGTYTIKTNLHTTDGMGLGDWMSDGYMDSESSVEFKFNPVSVDGYSNVYTLQVNSTNNYMVYVNTDPAVNAVNALTGTNNDYWLLIPKSARISANDYTFLMKNASMNTTWEHHVWTAAGYFESCNFGGGNAANMCAEVYNGIFDFYQQITGISNGKYELTCQGFYRGTESTLYANGSTVAMKNITSEVGSVNSMNDASTAFTAGKYQNTLNFVVANGTIQIGIQKLTTAWADWNVFTNFKLTRTGDATTEEQNTAISTAYTWATGRVTTAKDHFAMTGANRTALGSALTTYSSATADNVTGLLTAYNTALYDGAGSGVTGLTLNIRDIIALDNDNDFRTYLYNHGSTINVWDNVQACHSGFELAKIQAASSTDYTPMIRNAAVTVANYGWWGDVTNNGSAPYTGAPDNIYLANTGADYNVNQTVYGLPAGKYSVSAWTYASSAGYRKLYISNAEGDILTPASSAAGWVKLSGTFTLSEKTNIMFGFWGAKITEGTTGFDNWTLTRIGDVVKLNAAGYATYSANYDVEVSGAKAYTAVLDFAKSKITCSEITSNKVPAGNGVLLFGDADADVTLSITADAAALGDNNLKATTLADGTLATKESNDYYALSGDTFMKYTGDAFVHNKAYFEVEGGTALARSMRIVFDGNITGVANVEAAAEAKAKEGKFIENGKLVIVKNGVKYNAAGAQVK